MDMNIPDFSDPPILWSIPFTLLLITVIVAVADFLMPFITLNVEGRTWMWLASTLTTAVVSSLVTEKLTSDNKRTVISMVLASVLFSALYGPISGFFSKAVVNVVRASIPNPFLGMALSTSTITLMPGVLSGILLGGFFSIVPLSRKGIKDVFTKDSIDAPEPDLGYVKMCGRCGHNAPYDSRFCPYCGVPLTRREVPIIRFCRFCGSKISFLGQFCPDCGKEIEQRSRSLVYISQE